MSNRYNNFEGKSGKISINPKPKGPARAEAGISENWEMKSFGMSTDKDGNEVTGRATVLFEDDKGRIQPCTIWEPRDQDWQFVNTNRIVGQLWSSVLPEEEFEAAVASLSSDDFKVYVETLGVKIMAASTDKKFRLKLTYKPNGYLDIPFNDYNLCVETMDKTTTSLFLSNKDRTNMVKPTPTPVTTEESTTSGVEPLPF